MAKKEKTTKIVQATDLKGQMEEFERDLNDRKLLLLRKRLELRKVTELGYQAPESLVHGISLDEKEIAEKEITLACIKRDYKKVTRSIGYKAETLIIKFGHSIKGRFEKKMKEAANAPA